MNLNCARKWIWGYAFIFRLIGLSFTVLPSFTSNYSLVLEIRFFLWVAKSEFLIFIISKSVEQKICIKLCSRNEFFPTNSLRMMLIALQKAVIVSKTKNIPDDLHRRSSRPKTLPAICWLTITDEVGISNRLFNTNFNDVLVLIRVKSRLVPKTMLFWEKHQRVEICDTMLPTIRIRWKALFRKMKLVFMRTTRKQPINQVNIL